ncbi:serine hydrolase [Streptococcus sp. FT1-106]|uniref:serine hydrolase n=1 Tax=Streptococcus sp. FT1-106 TaxID=3409994 RepID=UPI003BF5CAC5
MKKLFAVMLIPFFLSPFSVISTEKTPVLSNIDKYHLTADVVTESTYFENIPSNPNLYQETASYKDENLTVQDKILLPDKALKIIDLKVNAQSIPVFELSDGTYLEASHQSIYDDVILRQESINENYWLKDGFILYDTPYVLGSKTVRFDLVAYSQVTVSQHAVTEHGSYYKINGKGWISEEFLSKNDNRIEKVQKVLSQKYNKSDFSIFVKQLDTGLTAGINQDEKMYAASIAKLATLYYTQEQIQEANIKTTDSFKYIDAVNQFSKAYDPSGSGKMVKSADNKDYSVDNLLKEVAQHSDNVATNILGYYVANQYDKSFETEISSILGDSFDMKERQMSSKEAADLLEAIFYQNGQIINYLSETEFDNERISKDITVQVAHKIGDAYDYKHDVAIVYTNKPFILSIFTNNSSYQDITNIANDVYSILK